MGTRTDDIGVWNNLGTVRAVRKVWTKTQEASGANATIRILFSSNDWVKLSGYVLIRPRYSTQNSDQAGAAVRIWPSEIPVTIEIPIPQDFIERSVFFRSFELMRAGGRRYRNIGVTPDANLDATVEELWG